MSESIDAVERMAELEVDNRRLRRLLDQQNAPGELRHRLRNTLAMLRTVIRKSALTAHDFEAYIGQLEDRLDAVARAQVAADEHGSVELHKLLADELFHYGASEGERAILTGPDVHLQPRMGQILALAIHELAVNAVEHGALGSNTGRVEVNWNVATDETKATLIFVWKERGLSELVKPLRDGFGTEVLTKTLAYEFEATTTLAFEPDGLRCTIGLPINERGARHASDKVDDR